MNRQFCWNCYNFEDRRDIDGVVLCTKGHVPGTTCEDFVEREDKTMEIRLNAHFCWNCCNFEDRRDIDGVILCAKGHNPKGNCHEFVNRCVRASAMGCRACGLYSTGRCPMGIAT